MTAPALRVVVAGGQEATCVGLRIALQQHGCLAVAWAPDVQSAVASVVAERPDACVLDILLPGGGGIAATREIKAAAPGVRVVVIAGERDDDQALAALSAGAHGCLPTDMDPAHLAAALGGVNDGENVLPRRLVEMLIACYRREAVRPDLGLIDRLTGREREVIEMLLENAPTSEVAYRLGVDAVTVRRHISGIVRKSGTTSRQAAIGIARGERSAAIARRDVQERLNTNGCSG